MQQVAVTRVIDGEQQPEDPSPIAATAVDVVSKGGRVVRATLDYGGEGFGRAEGGD